MFAGKFAKSERILSSRKSENKKKSLIMFTETCGRIWERCMPEIIFSKKKK